MSLCKACSTQNSEESKFCKMCGFALVSASGATPHVKPEEIDGLLSDGYRLVNEGLVDEAQFLVEAILQVDPDNSSALALKGAVHERKEELPLAVECYERVVELNPDSTLDRIKLAQLEKRIADEPTPQEEEVKGRNWVAIASAAAAVIVVSGVGVAIALNASKPAAGEETLVATEVASGFESAPRQDAAQAPIPNPQDFALRDAPAEPYSGSASVPLPNFRSGAPVASGNPLAGPGMSSPIWSPDAITPLPGGSGLGGSNSPGIVLPPPDDWRQPSSQGSPAPTTPDTGGAGDINIIPAPEKPKGKIEITVRGGGSGESREPDRAAESANIYRVARQKMSAGDYRGAIRDFQTALTGSGNSAQIHQFLGQCYKAIGEASSARSHYDQAIRLYEAQGNASAAEACRQALRTLG